MLDAAAYLSDALGEVVTEADILRLSLDGHLTLSVYLPNGAMVKRGKIVTHSIDDVVNAIANDEIPDDLNWAYLPKVPIEEKGAAAIYDDCSETIPFVTSLRLDDDQWITLDEKKVTSVWGVWDLPMIGGERLDVEHKYLGLTEGPPITAETMEGAFIWRGPEDICQVQADFDDNEYQDGSKAQGSILERYIVLDEIGRDEADKLRAIHEAARKKYMAYRKRKERDENFYPSGGLPADAIFVVRTRVLQEFVRDFSDQGDSADVADRPLSTRQRHTWLTVIAALCKEAGIDPKGRGATKQVVIAVDELGAKISEDTVRKILDEIPEAVESRSKT